MIFAVPAIIGLIVLARYALCGNRGLPLIGIAAFVANVLIWLTLPITGT
jgi:hypothetical protein